MNKQRAILKLQRFARAVGYYRLKALWYRVNRRILVSPGDPLGVGALAMLNADQIDARVGQYFEIMRGEFADYASSNAKAEPDFNAKKCFDRLNRALRKDPTIVTQGPAGISYKLEYHRPDAILGTLVFRRDESNPIPLEQRTKLFLDLQRNLYD